jgi:hypothetical protein
MLGLRMGFSWALEYIAVDIVLLCLMAALGWWSLRCRFYRKVEDHRVETIPQPQIDFAECCDCRLARHNPDEVEWDKVTPGSEESVISGSRLIGSSILPTGVVALLYPDPYDMLTHVGFGCRIAAGNEDYLVTALHNLKAAGDLVVKSNEKQVKLQMVAEKMLAVPGLDLACIKLNQNAWTFLGVRRLTLGESSVVTVMSPGDSAHKYYGAIGNVTVATDKGFLYHSASTVSSGGASGSPLLAGGNRVRGIHVRGSLTKGGLNEAISSSAIRALLNRDEANNAALSPHHAAREEAYFRKEGYLKHAEEEYRIRELEDLAATGDWYAATVLDEVYEKYYDRRDESCQNKGEDFVVEEDGHVTTLWTSLTATHVGMVARKGDPEVVQLSDEVIKDYGLEGLVMPDRSVNTEISSMDAHVKIARAVQRQAEWKDRIDLAAEKVAAFLKPRFPTLELPEFTHERMMSLMANANLDAGPGYPWVRFGSSVGQILKDPVTMGLIFDIVTERLEWMDTIMDYPDLTHEERWAFVRQHRMDPVRIMIKGEPHLIKKIEAHRERIIQATSIAAQILERHLTNEMHVFENNQAATTDDFPIMVGKDIASDSFLRLMISRRSAGWVGSDMSHFDWSQDKTWSQAYVGLKADLYGLSPKHERLLRANEWLMDNRAYVLSNGQIYECDLVGTHGTGRFETSARNCWLRLCLSVIGQEAANGAASLDLPVIVMGDDSFERFNNRSQQGQMAYTELMAKCGFTVKEWNHDFCGFNFETKGTVTNVITSCKKSLMRFAFSRVKDESLVGLKTAYRHSTPTILRLKRMSKDQRLNVAVEGATLSVV